MIKISFYLWRMEKKLKKIINNPFLVNEENEVWKSLLASSKPISQKDFEKKIKKEKK